MKIFNDKSRKVRHIEGALLSTVLFSFIFLAVSASALAESDENNRTFQSSVNNFVKDREKEPRENSPIYSLENSWAVPEQNMAGEKILRVDSRITNVRRSVFVEARIKHNTSVLWSAASVIGKLKCGEYEGIGYRHRKFRANVIFSNWYGLETINKWPVWVEFFNEKSFDGQNPTMDNIFLPEAKSILVDARNYNLDEKIFFYKAPSKDEPASFDDQPVKWVWPNKDKIIEVSLDSGYWAIASRRIKRELGTGEEIFKRLVGGFTVEY